MLERREALSTTIATHLITIASTPRDEGSVKKQWETFITVIRETAWKELRKTSKLLRGLIIVTTF